MINYCTICGGELKLPVPYAYGTQDLRPIPYI